MHCLHCNAEIQPHYKACPSCGERVSELLLQYPEGLIDGKYKILARLGAGGMGEVYKALHVSLNTVRVIKLMHPSLAADKEAQDRFLREARLASRVSHPNVATLHDFSVLPNGSFFMVSEFVDGSTLDKILRTTGALSPRRAASIAIKTLAGLDAIHRAGLIHRDVSPDNIMVATTDMGDEIVKIIDLGIAKGGDLADQQTRTGMFVGKWRYCSPEHLGILPAGEKIDARADLYSFGIVLYEMLTGAVPFVADAPEQYFHQHQRVTPKPFRVVQPSLPAIPGLEAIVFRALEKDRAKRFASAREMAAAIEAVLPSLPDRVDDAPTIVTAAPAITERAAATTLASTVPSAAAPTARSGISTGVVIGVAATLILLLAAAAGLFVLRSRRGERSTATTTTAPTTSQPATVIAATSDSAAPPTTMTASDTTATSTSVEEARAAGTTTVVEGKREPAPERRPPPPRAARPATTTRTAEAEPPPETSTTATAEPAEPESRAGRFRSRLPFRRRGGGGFDESDEARSADFRQGIIDDYSALRSNRYVTWAWKAPGVELARSPVRIQSFRGTHGDTFKNWIQSSLDDVTEEAEGPALTAEGAVFWSDASNGMRGVEIVIRDASKRIVARLRHRVRERDAEEAAEAAADAVADYYEEN